MTIPPDPIARSLAPGIAMTSAIFFNAGQLGRFTYVTGRVRELTREARELGRLPPGPGDRERFASIQAQVSALAARATMIRRTIALVYISLVSFITSILLLLGYALFEIRTATGLPIVAFAAGLVMFALATTRAVAEVALSYRTVEEEIRSSLYEKTQDEWSSPEPARRKDAEPRATSPKG